MWHRLIRSGTRSLPINIQNTNKKRGIDVAQALTSQSPSLGYFAKRDIPKGELLLFVPEEDIFTAKQVYALKDSYPMFGVVQDALEGYDQLRKARPSVFQELELSLLLWFERRAEYLGCPTKFEPWSGDLPDFAQQTLPFLTSDTVLPDIATNTKQVSEEITRYNQMVSIFSNAISEDLDGVFQYVKQHNGAWGLGDPDRDDVPFLELFKEELSLVGSRAHDFSKLGPSPIALPSCRGAVSLLTYIDFFDHSSTPNAHVVIPLEPNTEEGRKRLSTWPNVLQHDVEFPEDLLQHGPGVAVFATRSIADGEEVTISYGKNSNKQRFLRYGFLEEGVEWDIGDVQDTEPTICTVDLDKFKNS